MAIITISFSSVKQYSKLDFLMCFFSTNNLYWENLIISMLLIPLIFYQLTNYFSSPIAYHHFYFFPPMPQSLSQLPPPSSPPLFPPEWLVPLCTPASHGIKYSDTRLLLSYQGWMKQPSRRKLLLFFKKNLKKQIITLVHNTFYLSI